ncbi:uncharacterized protein LOC129376703 [Poeciliopsis prolifica]|uniref:uncharacterized protein LOC129376703 n=1 Tax=Poeciliopsis prolifica TaxID=188132 RepID=UPI0024144C88|nr:uncharacterized protein LOC129376703 [Poeciliopsis prolifica]
MSWSHSVIRLVPCSGSRSFNCCGSPTLPRSRAQVLPKTCFGSSCSFCCLITTWLHYLDGLLLFVSGSTLPPDHCVHFRVSRLSAGSSVSSYRNLSRPSRALPDPVNIKAEPGENVNLPCEADRNSKVSAVILTRNDLEPEYVFLYRDEEIDVDLQNPQYSGRTELHSLYITDGKVNVTIKNVTEKDSGDYECSVRAGIGSNTRRKRAASEKTTTIIKLSVAAAPPPGGGHIGPVLKVVAVVAVLAPLVGFVWKKRNVSPPQDETVETLQA